MKITDQLQLLNTILSTFNPSRESINDHAIALLNLSKQEPQTYSAEDESVFTRQNSSKEDKALAEDEYNFILELAVTIVDYKPFLSTLIDILYAENPSLNQQYKNYYRMFFAFVFFRLSGKNFGTLTRMLKILNPPAILPFLRLVFESCQSYEEIGFPVETKLAEEAKLVVREAHFAPELQAALLQQFDERHLQALISTIIEQNYANGINLIHELSRVFEVNKPKDVALASSGTKPQEFALTALNPDVKYEEHVICNNYTAEPYKADGKTVEMVQNERQIAVLVKKREPTVPDASADKQMKPAPLHNAGKHRAEQRIEDAHQELLRAQERQRLKDRELHTKLRTQQAPKVQLTKAEILRENELLQRKKQEAAAQLEAYAKGLHDGAEYDAWRAEMEARDQMAQQKQTLLHKQEAKAAFSRAIAGKQLHVKKLQEDVQGGQIERYEERIKNELAKQQELEEQRQLNEERNLQNEQSKREAAQRLQQEKQQAKQLEDQAALEKRNEAREMQLLQQLEKFDLVKQIKALLEVASANRDITLLQRFNPAETAKHGLLEEMSLVELQTRLAEMRTMQQQLNEEKRARILSEKQQEKAELEQKKQEVEEVKLLLKKARATDYRADQKAALQRAHEDEVAQMKAAEHEAQQIAEKQLKRQELLATQKEREIAAKAAKLQELKAQMRQIQSKNSTSLIFSQNASIDSRRNMRASQALSSEREASARQNYLKKQREQEKEKLQQLNDQNRVLQEQRREQMQKTLEEKRELVLREKENQSKQLRKQILIDPYKAKAMGKEVPEVFL